MLGGNMPIITKEFICVSCPVGCNLAITQSGDNIEVSGNQCDAGIAYAEEEMTNPTRNIATSIRVFNGDMPMLSVKTSRPIPKSAIMDVVNAIHEVEFFAPVHIGDIILPNAYDTGVDIIATRNIKLI